MYCLFFKTVLNFSFEATETYFHKNVYTSDVKKPTFGRPANLFLCFGHLMYIKVRLVISSTERQHAIISDVHKGLGHDSKTAKAMALYCGKGFNNTKDLK